MEQSAVGPWWRRSGLHPELSPSLTRCRRLSLAMGLDTKEPAGQQCQVEVENCCMLKAAGSRQQAAVLTD